MEQNKKNYWLLSIRNRIVAFAILLTLLPSLGMGLLLNNMLQSTLAEKVEQQFIDSANIVEREITLWLKELRYDLNVFSNSFVITENFSKYLSAEKIDTDPTIPVYIKTMTTYLTSLQTQFNDYSRLFVLSNDGQLVASSDNTTQLYPAQLPSDNMQQIETNHFFIGDIYFDEAHLKPLILIGVPLFTGLENDQVGVLAIEINLQGALPFLESSILNANKKGTIHQSLIRLKDGKHCLFTENAAHKIDKIQLSQDTLRGSIRSPHLHEYNYQQGERIMGLLVPFDQLSWGLFIAEDYDDMFALVINSRNEIILIASALGLFIGLMATILTRQIMIPLSALTTGAKKVAAGNLEIQLPVYKNDEIGFATTVFNEMVAKLKQSQTTLKQIATTDPLTTLANRKKVMATLREHFDYSKRYKTAFSVLMVDVDHFKMINDTYGHQAGDTVLKQISLVFLENLRNVDSAGRYGGEEFLFILPESVEEEALHVAERIRMAVAKHTFSHEDTLIKVTVSIGASKILENDKDEHIAVKRADKALYKAKANGRDQVVYLATDSFKASPTEKIIQLSQSS